MNPAGFELRDVGHELGRSLSLGPGQEPCLGDQIVIR